MAVTTRIPVKLSSYISRTFLYGYVHVTPASLSPWRRLVYYLTWLCTFQLSLWTAGKVRGKLLAYKGWLFHHVHQRNVHRQNVHRSHWWRLAGSLWVISHLWPWPYTQSSRRSFQRHQQINRQSWLFSLVFVCVTPSWNDEQTIAATNFGQLQRL